MDPQGTVFMNQAIDFPGDITILHGTARLKYADGSLADVKSGIYNHHTVFADTSKRPLAVVACPGKSARPAVPISVMLATGEDNTIYQYASEDAGFNGGYYVGKQDGIWFTAEIVNYSSDNKTIYAVMEFDYVDGKGKVDVTSENLSVTQCDGSIGIRPPKGQKKFDIESKPMKVEHDGALFGIRKHAPAMRLASSNLQLRWTSSRWRNPRSCQDQWQDCVRLESRIRQRREGHLGRPERKLGLHGLDSGQKGGYYDADSAV